LLLLVARWWRGVSHPQNQAACVFFSGVGDSLGHVLLEYNQLPISAVIAPFIAH